MKTNADDLVMTVASLWNIATVNQIIDEGMLMIAYKIIDMDNFD